MTDRPLTPKQQAFVTAYLGEARGNATQAARLAGYKGDDRTLGVTGHDLLNTPKILRELAGIREEVRQRAQESHQAAILSAEELQVWLSGVVWGTVKEAVTVAQKTPEGKSPAEADNFVEVEQPARIRDRIPAAALLSKLAGYDREKTPEPPSAPAVNPEMERALIRLAQLSADQWEAFMRGDLEVKRHG